MKYYIEDYIRENSQHKNMVDLGVLSPQYEPTRKIVENRDKITVFRVEGSSIECYANILSTRRDLYHLFRADSDAELYEKMLEAMNNPWKEEYGLFDEYYKDSRLTLNDIPFIRYYAEDAGPYLTSSIISSCYRGVCNASFHRMLRLDEYRAAVRIVPRHLHLIVGKYHEEGRDAPAVVLLGLHPVYELSAATSPPFGVYEFGIAERILGGGVFVKTPIHGIPVPAYASIIIEGVITREMEWEGPFVDILRLPDKKRKQPVFKIEAIYTSRLGKPMVHAIVPGFDEHFILMGFPREPLIYDAVKRVVPGVKSVRLTPGSGSWLHVIVSISKKRRGEAKNAGLAVLNAHPSVKHVVVVDDDIDIDDPFMVEWAIATRVRGGEDLIILRSLRGSTLDPRGENGVGDKVIIDATKPFDEPWDKYRMVKPR